VNGDRIVDGADYTLWADNYLEPKRQWDHGDFNGNGVVDGADYTIWADNFAPLFESPLSASPVPEPGTLPLAALGLFLLATWQCRKRTP
jgi:hypothetical protein